MYKSFIYWRLRNVLTDDCILVIISMHVDVWAAQLIWPLEFTFVYFLSSAQTLEWQQVATGFMSQYSFPNCIGALDGKYVNICPPPGSGSTYHN